MPSLHVPAATANGRLGIGRIPKSPRLSVFAVLSILALILSAAISVQSIPAPRIPQNHGSVATTLTTATVADNSGLEILRRRSGVEQPRRRGVVALGKRTGHMEVSIRIRERLLNEVALTATRMLLYNLQHNTTFRDVEFTPRIPVINKPVHIEAKNIRISHVDIESHSIKLKEGYLALVLRDVRLTILVDMYTDGAHRGTWIASAQADGTGRAFISVRKNIPTPPASTLTSTPTPTPTPTPTTTSTATTRRTPTSTISSLEGNTHLQLAFREPFITFKSFALDAPSGILNNILHFINNLFHDRIKTQLNDVLETQLQASIQNLLNELLRRRLRGLGQVDVDGDGPGMEMLGFEFEVEFVGEVVVTPDEMLVDAVVAANLTAV
ncbi:hypothetical protein HK102_009135 [Quaeritorhiza haematococci]|nr:hypothetical protein HK102_009135 [Quaeritorhiza haematococci]